MIRELFRSSLERIPSLAQFIRNNRDLLDRYSPSITTPWGFTLSGHETMATGAFEPEETQLVRVLLKDVDVLVNVGANVGYYCCHALSMGKKVIAVEPNARNLYYLLKNINNNHWSKLVEIFPVALGRSSGVLQMWGGGTGASLIKGWAGTPESYVNNVPVLTLDRILGDEIHGKKALILVDVEGAEYMMLQGALKTLSNEPRPIWIIESSISEHQPEGLKTNQSFEPTFELMFDSGYRAYTAELNEREITKDNVKHMIAEKNEFRAHNFLFR